MPISRRTFLAAGAAGAASLAAGRLRAVESSSGPEFSEFTSRSERSIHRGYEWLLKTFNRDDGCGVDIGTPSDISCTAAVALSLLSNGNSPVDGPRSLFVRRCIRHVLEAVRYDRFSVDLNTQVKADLCGWADHHFAAILLSQVLGQGTTIDPEKQALAKLVQQIGEAQTPEGHWGQGRYPNLASVTGWLSLRGAHFAGVKVEASPVTTAKYLLAMMEANGDLFNNAAGIRVLYAMQLENEPVGKRAFDQAIRSATVDFPKFNQFGGEQYLAFHYINETMLTRGGDYWAKWFPVVRDKLIEVQNTDGSWIGHSCIVSRTFCTACALLVLTSPNRYLPISQV